MDSDREAALLKYSELWEYRDYEDHSFNNKGLVKSVITELNMDKKEHITDWGCGAGLTAKTFINEGFFVHGIDIAPNCLAEEMKDFHRFYFSEQCLWALTEKVTKTPWFICTYTLEHLPEKKLHAVLHQIYKKTEYGGLFVISLIEDEFGPKSINQGLHLTVRAARWWYDQLSRYWDVTYDTRSDYMIVYAVPKKEANDYAGSWPVY